MFYFLFMTGPPVTGVAVRGSLFPSSARNVSLTPLGAQLIVKCTQTMRSLVNKHICICLLVSLMEWFKGNLHGQLHPCLNCSKNELKN